jgi:hypothetical protein
VAADPWSAFAGRLLGEPVVVSGWFRPANVSASLHPWEPTSASILAAIGSWRLRRAAAAPGVKRQLMTDLPRSVFVAVTADRLGMFDLVGGPDHVHARTVVGTGDRDGVVVVIDEHHPTWLCLELRDGRLIALEPASADEDVDAVRRAIRSGIPPEAGSAARRSRRDPPDDLRDGA